MWQWAHAHQLTGLHLFPFLRQLTLARTEEWAVTSEVKHHQVAITCGGGGAVPQEAA